MDKTKTKHDAERSEFGVAIDDRLWEHRQIFNTILEATPCGFSLVDADGRITFWNPAAENLTGLAPSQVIGRPCKEVFNCPNFDLMCPLAQSLRGEK